MESLEDTSFADVFNVSQEYAVLVYRGGFSGSSKVSTSAHASFRKPHLGCGA